MNVTNFYYFSAFYVLVVRSPMPTVGLSSLCIRLNEMVAAAEANLGKLNGRDKSLHKMSDGRRARGPFWLRASERPRFRRPRWRVSGEGLGRGRNSRGRDTLLPSLPSPNPYSRNRNVTVSGSSRRSQKSVTLTRSLPRLPPRLYRGISLYPSSAPPTTLEWKRAREKEIKTRPNFI